MISSRSTAARRQALPLDRAFDRWLVARMKRLYGEPCAAELPADMRDLVHRLAATGSAG